MVKPRIKRGLIWLRKSPPELVEGWICSAGGFAGEGLTPNAAYWDWATAFGKAEHQMSSRSFYQVPTFATAPVESWWKFW